MHATIHGERTLTELDHLRLTRLLDGNAVPHLEDLLDATDVVQSRDIDPDIVTMYSQISIEDAHSGQRHTLTLCYPRDAAPEAGFVSVLSPVGCGLLGLRAGALATWRMPGGDQGGARITEIHFQPEAHGDYTT